MVNQGTLEAKEGPGLALFFAVRSASRELTGKFRMLRFSTRARRASARLGYPLRSKRSLRRASQAAKWNVEQRCVLGLLSLLPCFDDPSTVAPGTTAREGGRDVVVRSVF